MPGKRFLGQALLVGLKERSVLSLASGYSMSGDVVNTESRLRRIQLDVFVCQEYSATIFFHVHQLLHEMRRISFRIVAENPRIMCEHCEQFVESIELQLPCSSMLGRPMSALHRSLSLALEGLLVFLCF